MKTFISVNGLIFTVLTIFLFHTKGIAQVKEKHAGKYAFQFQIGSNFTLSTFQGSIFSGKYNFTENDAIRMGVTLNVNNQNQNNLNGGQNPASFNSIITNNRVNTYGFIIQYLRNNYLKNNFNLYFGGGPSFSYGQNKSGVNYASVINYTSNNQIQRYYGITACIGIEWYFNKSMSLSAQYGIAYNYYENITLTNSVMSNIQNSFTHIKTTGFTINPNSVLFGLSIYF